MQYYKVHADPMNFLPQIRFDRGDDSLTRVSGSFKFNPLVSHSTANLHGNGGFPEKNEGNFGASENITGSQTGRRRKTSRKDKPVKYKLPELGDKHRKLLLRID